MMQPPSYVSGPATVPLCYDTIGQALARAAARWPDGEALVSCHQGVRLTWRELHDRAAAMAAGLTGMGLQPGDRIGIWAPNRVEWAVTQFAAALAGLILVTINPAYRLHEVRFALTKVGCTALVTADRFKSSDYLAMLAELAPELATAEPGRLQAAALPALRWVIRLGGEAPGTLAFDAVPGLAGDDGARLLAERAATLQAEDPINIQFTSGTTGLPKGATLTHHNILNNAVFTGATMAVTAADRICIPVPLYHCFGMVIGNLLALATGAAMVYPADSFEAAATLRAIQDERCTVIYGVPTMFIAMLEDPGFAATDFSSLRTGIMAGSPCPVAVMRRVVTDMHVPEVTIAYGMTETSPVSFQSRVDDPVERRVATVGRALPHLEAKVVDAQGRVVPQGERGELLVRGYAVMQGYWDDAARTAEAIDAGGWMHTGDLATLDADGFCNIVGRAKDMLIRGGENIYPREIEEFLYRHPAVQDVQVFGVPDEKFGEEVCAWIRLREGERLDEQGLRDYCRGQIAHYKIPRHIRFVDGYPMTVTGKVQKFAMRKLMMDELGVAEAVTA